LRTISRTPCYKGRYRRIRRYSSMEAFMNVLNFLYTYSMFPRTVNSFFQVIKLSKTLQFHFLPPPRNFICEHLSLVTSGHRSPSVRESEGGMHTQSIYQIRGWIPVVSCESRSTALLQLKSNRWRNSDRWQSVPPGNTFPWLIVLFFLSNHKANADVLIG
jgi:hypothetical protein